MARARKKSTASKPQAARPRGGTPWLEWAAAAEGLVLILG